MVQDRADNKSLAAAHRAEIKRVREHFRQRRQYLQYLLDTLSAREIRHVRAINKQTNYGYLAELWDEFLHLKKGAMKQALDDERFNDMPWQSLLQANPFIMARVGTWDKNAISEWLARAGEIRDSSPLRKFRATNIDAAKKLGRA